MDFTDDDGLGSGSSSNPVMNYYLKAKAHYQFYMDKVTPHTKERWIGLTVMVALFVLRIIISQGWYVVCYALGIYLLSQFLAFLTPKFDMTIQQDEANQELEAGERADEFRPFIRRLPEFKFWHNAFRATAASLLATLFSIFDIPVYWPILLMYFILLFLLTMKRQIQHMVEYKYIPLDIGKKKYNSQK
ncbi:similar to Saccharomyces cerevisiae YCL001W RER1 Protein involved in retention of membrane proteins, including Sec12p, in the ER [Maudiozyma barnettii]|uniref:Protein RER1 n=1 Tax=Maudiozyma barnettii TaxID=61262 RepID=A0A8H2VCN6_9SACH|nr:protein retrieval receptor [Kazachstania barnettii]CAB4252777.1 similar to Saccharomyces cerevisiae YCL001W RER1 Protein involved in retention of membrane proteins, including Sec12p, in the ER [Kazachstania barnettii]CAD1780567.1 similar to Saccharomyces cerevisiae YCL001W RER1 Protein involved in retention of membrane proteins, including Sec12p, in the ER [Kazachstania barnettii]